MSTSNTRNICQNCGNGIDPGARHCGQCGFPLALVSNKTTISTNNNSSKIAPTIPSGPSTPQIPYMPPGVPKLPVQSKPPFWTSGKVIVLLVLFLFIGVLLGFQLGKGSTTGSSTPPTTSTTGNSTPSTTSTTAAGTTALTPPPSDTPTSAPTVKTIPKNNLNIPCLNCGTSPLKFTLVLNKITIDSTQNTTMFFLVVKNVGNEDYGNLRFIQLTLQNNEDGTILAGTISNTSGDYFSLARGNSVVIVASFSPVTKAGVHYTLMVVIHDGFYDATFQNETFTF